MHLNVLKYLQKLYELRCQSSVPDGGFGEAAFFVELPAAISDFAGQVGNILGSIAFGISLKYSALSASSQVILCFGSYVKNCFIKSSPDSVNILTGNFCLRLLYG